MFDFIHQWLTNYPLAVTWIPVLLGVWVVRDYVLAMRRRLLIISPEILLKMESHQMPEIATLAAVISAMVDVITLGKETYQTYYERRLKDPDADRKRAALASALSTFSDKEVKAIVDRIEGCRKRFEDQFGGQDRKKCLCSVLRQVKEGNGGTIPDTEWEAMYKTLGCAA